MPLYYLDKDGNKQDAELHQQILDEGDEEAALRVSRRILREMGLPEDFLKRSTNANNRPPR